MQEEFIDNSNKIDLSKDQNMDKLIGCKRSFPKQFDILNSDNEFDLNKYFVNKRLKVENEEVLCNEFSKMSIDLNKEFEESENSNSMNFTEIDPLG